MTSSAFNEVWFRILEHDLLKWKNSTYRVLSSEPTAPWYASTISLFAMTKYNSKALQQTPEPIFVGSNTDTVDVISIGWEHCSLEGVKRPAVKKC